MTVVAQVWVSLEEGLLVGPSKTDYPLEVFVQETRPVRRVRLVAAPGPAPRISLSAARP